MKSAVFSAMKAWIPSTIRSLPRVELYQAYADFNDMMDLFEELLSSAAKELLGSYELQWQGEKLNLAPGWPRLTMHEAVKQYVGIDFMAIDSDEAAVAAAKAVGVEIPEGKDRTWAMHSMSALTKR